MPATGRNQAFEQPHNFTGGQVGVKLAGDTEKPSVDTFTGSRRRGQQIVNELWKLARHDFDPFVTAGCL
jgi:hypothetical protein